MLTLQIGTTAYAVTHIKGNWWLLEKADGTAYEVGSDCLCGPSCSCPDYRYRREGLDSKGCKHVVALTDLGILPVIRTGPVDLAPTQED